MRQKSLSFRFGNLLCASSSLVSWMVACVFFSSSAFSYTHFQDKTVNGATSIAWWPKTSFPIALFVDADPTSLAGKTWYQVVQSSARRWSSVPGSFAKITALQLLQDINGSNFLEQVKVGDGRQEIVLEQDGKILTSLGLDPSFVAGVGVPFVKSSGDVTPKPRISGVIQDGFVVINGKLAWNATRMERVVLHELGHLLGMAHTNVAHPLSSKQLPIMFYDPLQTTREVGLHADDQAGVAALYPDKGYEKQYATIRGRITRANQKPVFGAVVIVEPVGGGEPIGAWSDHDGRFEVSGIPPGKVLLHARALNGSATVRQMDPAIHLGGVYQNAAREFCPELFNDQPYEFCRIQPSPRDGSVLTLTAGQSLVGVNLQEGPGGKASGLQCLVGSWPRLNAPGRDLAVPPYSDNRKRGARCAEKMPEPGEPVTDAAPLDNVPRPPETPLSPEERRLKELGSPQGQGCLCQSSTQDFPFGWMWLCVFALVLGLFRKRRRQVGVFVLFLMLCLPAVSEALVIRKPTWEQLKQQSTRIVKARVLSNKASRTKGGIPLLRTTFQVQKAYKGGAVSTVSTQLLGLASGNARVPLQAIPRFAPGTTVVLFLKPIHNSAHSLLVGLFYGVFDVKNNKQGQKVVVSRGAMLPDMTLPVFEKTLSSHSPSPLSRRPTAK